MFDLFLIEVKYHLCLQWYQLIILLILIIDNKLFLIKIPIYGDNCRHKGEDISKGSLVLKKGTKISKKDIMLLRPYVKNSIKIENLNLIIGLKLKRNINKQRYLLSYCAQI